jgi:hypothetical protein
MNHQLPDLLSELNRRRIQDEMAAIRLEQEATKGKSLSSRSLANLGKWMIKKGEKLRSEYETSSEAASESVLRRQTRKVGA